MVAQLSARHALSNQIVNGVTERIGLPAHLTQRGTREKSHQGDPQETIADKQQGHLRLSFTRPTGRKRLGFLKFG